MPTPRKPRPRDASVTLTDLARLYRRRTSYIRRLAALAGVTLRARTWTPMRNGKPDTRPRRTARRRYEPLTAPDVKAIVIAHVLTAGGKGYPGSTAAEIRWAVRWSERGYPSDMLFDSIPDTKGLP